MPIEKVAVIGAGLMGGAIAAHVANSGHEAVLLDIVPEGGGDRNALAEGAVARMLKADPAPFMDPSDARRIATGNLDDHLHLLGDADWIVEAVTEKVAVKQEVYRRIDPVRKTGAIVSSNTSTIPWRVLADGMPDAFARDFLITHFFNPPRYMRLLEVVAGPATRGDAAAQVSDFADRVLGKSVVSCNDTPGFIANRIGTYWLVAAIGAALDGGVTVEEADALMGRPIGVPRTGVFGLIDLVGLDLMPLVGRSLRDALPADDPLRTVYGEPEIVRSMIAEGYTGRKGKGGFYRLDPDSGKREKQVIDLRSGEYGPALRPKLESVEQAGSSLRALFEFPDRTGEYAWRVMSGTLAYAAGLVPEIADDVEAVDRAMRLGYNWKRGPFELIDEVGAAWFAGRLEDEGREVPALLRAAADAGGFYRSTDGRLERLDGAGGYAPVARPPGVLLLADVKRAGPRLAGNGSASLWDLGDGVACLEFHSKMNALDPDIMALIGESVEIVGRDMTALVIHNEGGNFSVGMNLGLALFALNVGAWPMIEETLKGGQDAFNALKFAPFPVVGAPSGMALGGGCEVLLHCDAVQAHAESYIGLVEAGVGIVPGWGGCKEMMLRGLAAKGPGFGGPMTAISKAFETIGLAKVSRSAKEARKLGFLREGDAISANRDRLLADAKAKALALAEGYAAPEPATVRLPGKTGRIALKMAVKGLAKTGKATAHDLVVVDHLGTVLTGGDTDATRDIPEARLSELERRAILALIRMPATIARMEHMLETGKPLRN
ncbi:MAG: 3-hydroxyacyl-CoA dehydrogenase NAD-binding domain-containing protein [Defluviicoccus sp.]|nr:3-hydroxyacyl-CoA dehydrogenase NAD-binding domain-containing protein [Defluviicoccus sp.]